MYYLEYREQHKQRDIIMRQAWERAFSNLYRAKKKLQKNTSFIFSSHHLFFFTKLYNFYGLSELHMTFGPCHIFARKKNWKKMEGHHLKSLLRENWLDLAISNWITTKLTVESWIVEVKMELRIFLLWG